MVLRRDERSLRLRSEHQEGPSACDHWALFIRSTSRLHRLLRRTHRRVDGDVLEGSLALSVRFNEYGWRGTQLYLVRGGGLDQWRFDSCADESGGRQAEASLREGVG